MTEHTGFHNKVHYSSDCPACNEQVDGKLLTETPTDYGWASSGKKDTEQLEEKVKQVNANRFKTAQRVLICREHMDDPRVCNGCPDRYICQKLFNVIFGVK